jgi:hypothetical protein
LKLVDTPYGSKALLPFRYIGGISSKKFHHFCGRKNWLVTSVEMKETVSGHVNDGDVASRRLKIGMDFDTDSRQQYIHLVSRSPMEDK